ncbi:MAG: methylisocitrate lyase [Pseudohongiellaceae bacterium]
MSPGAKFKAALRESHPLQVVGTINAYCAMLAERAGHKAIYLSGGGVANASFGLPDLGITTLADVTDDVKRICDATTLPLLVDIDTGWGNAFNIERSVKTIEKAGAAAVHIEDQVSQKRCGHRPNKSIVSKEEMVDRIKAASSSRTDADFVIMARTDALAVEGIESALDRAIACVEAGADAIFPEAILDLDQYKLFTEVLEVPVLANITEFGKTPLYTCNELNQVGVSIVLYPLSAFRAMSKAAMSVYETIAVKGSQMDIVNLMQTRDELYETLEYHSYEEKLDKLFTKENNA